jgi:hypothetical protein
MLRHPLKQGTRASWAGLFTVLFWVPAIAADWSQNLYIDTSVAQPERLIDAIDTQGTSDTLYLFSHGRPGELLIDGQWRAAENLADWLEASGLLRHKTKLNLYGCNFAQGLLGRQAVALLASRLDLSVAASDDLTGQGGDWILEEGHAKPLHVKGYMHTLVDTDRDGIQDNYDIDSDNDGILDSIEGTKIRVNRTIKYATGTGGKYRYDPYWEVAWVSKTSHKCYAPVPAADNGRFVKAYAPQTPGSFVRPTPGSNWISHPGSSRGEISAGNHKNADRDGTINECSLDWKVKEGKYGDSVRLVFRTYVTLPETLVPGSINGILPMSADNYMDSIYINGVRNPGLGQNETQFTYRKMHYMNAPNGWKPGLNKVEVSVRSGPWFVAFLAGKDIQYSALQYRDTDGDDTPDYLDLDSDNDGIPDNIEAFKTAEYIAPNYNVGRNGLHSNYENSDSSYATSKATLPDTDGDRIPDYIDSDSDNDGLSDCIESLSSQNCPISPTDTSRPGDTNGLISWADTIDNYTDVNAKAYASDIFALLDTDNDTDDDGRNAQPTRRDFDYRDDFEDTIVISYPDFFIDAINENFTYSDNKNITTKIANQPFNLKLVNVQEGLATAYDGDMGFQLPVLLRLADETNQSTTLLSDSLPTFEDGDSTIRAIVLKLPKAHKAKRVGLNYIDWRVLDWMNLGGNGCPQDERAAQTSGLGVGLPSCIKNANDIDAIFGANTCTDPRGPCRTPNPDSNIYDHDLGCFHCLTNTDLGKRNPSTDDFAVRPKDFEIHTTASIDLLHSGAGEYFTVEARDETGTPTEGYAQPSQYLDLNQTLYLSTGSVDTSGILSGRMRFTNPNDFNITDGISIPTTLVPVALNNEVVGITFSDVGRAAIRLSDYRWAEVDSDDTPLDCNATSNDSGTPIEAGRTICGTSPVLTYIPDYFDVEQLGLSNGTSGGNFTYLSNDLNMSARVGVTIISKSADGNTTQNFDIRTGYYDNNLTVDLNVTDWDPSLTNRHPDQNPVIIRDIGTPTTLNFANGSATLAGSTLAFNYQRTNDAPVDPFRVPLSDINVSVASRYVGSDGTKDTIIGTGVETNATNKATFAYGRIQPTQPYYTSQQNTKTIPITVQLYCDLWSTNPANCFGINTANRSQDDWFLSNTHNTVLNDGDIGLVIGPITTADAQPGAAVFSSNSNLATTPVAITDATGMNSTTTVTRTSGSMPMRVDVNLTTTGFDQTDSWLIFNPLDPILPPDPFLYIIFEGAAGWAGQGNTGSVVTDMPSTEKNRKTGW